MSPGFPGPHDPASSGPEEPGNLRPVTRKSSRARRIVLVCACVLATMACGAAVFAYIVVSQLGANPHRIPDVFRGLNPATRPIMPAATRNSITILLAGSDIRSATPTTGSRATRLPFEPGAQRSDLLMLLHIDADRRHISLVSIPRDSWVPVPGHGMMKINAGLSLGGPPLMIATVEHLTNVRINHYALIDFDGFQAMVQALSDVDVEVAQQTSSGGFTFHRGLNQLSPAAALVYVRQRDGLPGGDLSRIQRQQNLMRAVLAKTATEHVLTDPVALYRLLSALTRALSVDSTFTNAQLDTLAFQLRGLRARDVTYVTAPVLGFGWRDLQSVVFLDRAKCAQLWPAIRNDSVAAFAARYPDTVTPLAPS